MCSAVFQSTLKTSKPAPATKAPAAIHAIGAGPTSSSGSERAAEAGERGREHRAREVDAQRHEAAGDETEAEGRGDRTPGLRAAERALRHDRSDHGEGPEPARRHHR